MLIQEEYARRHAMSMTLASHTLKEGTAFLRSDGSGRILSNVTHLVMNVRWVPHERHPGTYQLFFQKPSHDSHGGRTNFNLLQDPTTLNYEEFELILRSFRRSSLPNFHAICEPRATSLFAWEMFVCCYDGWIVRNGTSRLLSHVEASIDPMLTVEKRYEHYEAAINTIGHENSQVLEKWQMNFVGQRKKIIPWLGKIFNGD
jgi:hypothetical protein